MYGPLISSVTVGSGGASSVSFSSIPATYTDLCVVVSAQHTGYGITCMLTLNGSSSNFSMRELYGTGSSVASQTTTDGAVFIDGGPSGPPNSAQLYFPNYAGSTYKSFSMENVTEANATSARQQIQAGLWSNTAAITSITFTPIFGVNLFGQYSTFYLYGLLKGSGGATVS